MQTFNNGRKIFFLYPPREFSMTVLSRLFREGYEIYAISAEDKLIPLFREFPDALLFINTDYPYSSFNLQNFCDNQLKAESLENVGIYTFFSEGVSFAEGIRDYISLDRDESEVLEQLREILEKETAHGKREFVRFGSYEEVLSAIEFSCEGEKLNADMHDISPKALSFSSSQEMSLCVGKKLMEISLRVGAYSIEVSGTLDSMRTIAGKDIYIVMFEGDAAKKDEIFNFIFTSLEKKMDELISKL